MNAEEGTVGRFSSANSHLARDAPPGLLSPSPRHHRGFQLVVVVPQLSPISSWGLDFGFFFCMTSLFLVWFHAAKTLFRVLKRGLSPQMQKQDLG